MCGRYNFTAKKKEIYKLFGIEPSTNYPFEILPNYNIAPTHRVLVLLNDSERRLDYFRWGLIPFWAKDEKIGYKMINTRAETIHEKPAFKGALRKRRCLIAATGFYEWRKEGKNKIPLLFYLKSKEPFEFAGIYEVWRPKDREEVIWTCSIITTSPNNLVKKIHDRMPVILPKKLYDHWIDPTVQEDGALMPILGPYPAKQMMAHEVSDLVNSVKNNSPELIKPVK